MTASKDHLYEQVARIGKTLASSKRLELIDLLCQGEKSVESLASEARISFKLASAHLRELRVAQLVETRKEGKFVLYRLAGTGVADLWVNLRGQAEERLVELQLALLDQRGDTVATLTGRGTIEEDDDGKIRAKQTLTQSVVSSITSFRMAFQARPD